MGFAVIRDLAIKRRSLRWKAEKASEREAQAHREMVAAIAAWKGVKTDRIKLSNICCSKAPADLNCVFVSSGNPMRNPCVFCGNPEESVF